MSVWLDQIQYEEPPIFCIDCEDQLNGLGVMIKWVNGSAITPLCRICFDKPPKPDDYA